MIPASQCRAKGGPTTCRFHAPMMLNGISSLIRSAKTNEEKREYEYQRHRLERTIKLHKDSQKIYAQLHDAIKEAEISGTEDDEHPESVSFNGHTSKVLRASKLPDNAERHLIAAGIANPKMYELSPEDGGAELFHSLMESTRTGNKHAAAVYVYPCNEYKDMKIFVSDNLRSGYALKWQESEQTYDIVSVFSIKKQPQSNNSKEKFKNLEKEIDESHKPVAQALLINAIANGGRMLDCFDTVLPSLYASVGFKQVGYDAWDEQYRPDGWREDDFKNFNHGRPGVVYMRYDGEPWKAPNMNDINMALLPETSTFGA